MKDLMFAEFARHQVLPVDASAATRMVTQRPDGSGGRKVFTYSGVPVTGIPRGTAPSVLNTSYTITADVDVPQDGAQGMIVTDGGRFGGFGLYLLKGVLVFTWNLLDLKRVKWQRPEALTPGKHTLEFDFKYDGLGFGTLAYNNISGIGQGRAGTFKVDCKLVSTQKLERSVPLTLPWNETFDIGSDTGTPVDDQEHQIPFKFTGTIDKLKVALDEPHLTPADLQKLTQAAARASDAP